MDNNRRLPCQRPRAALLNDLVIFLVRLYGENTCFEEEILAEKQNSGARR
jgi:hypothetical protein